MNIIILLKEFISRLLYFTAIPIWRKFRKCKGCIILLYHEIPKNKFEKIIKYLRKYNYNILHLNDLAYKLEHNIPIPDNSVVITFDDGYKSLYTDIFPIVKKYKVPVTIFLVSDYIGYSEPFWWDIKLSDIIKRENRHLYAEWKKIPNRVRKKKLLEIWRKFDKAGFENRLLSWKEIYEMNRCEFIDFQSHSRSHHSLVYSSNASDEILISKKLLEKELNKHITSFSYPFGDFTEEHVDIVRRAGYKIAVTTEIGVNDNTTNPYKLRRVALHNKYILATYMHSPFRKLF